MSYQLFFSTINNMSIKKYLKSTFKLNYNKKKICFI